MPIKSEEEFLKEFRACAYIDDYDKEPESDPEYIVTEKDRDDKAFNKGIKLYTKWLVENIANKN